MATIQEVYIALFGRPADPVGLRFYVEATNDGANLDAVGALSGSDEYLDRFEGQSDVQMINQIFQDLFGRDADASGLLFYTQLLQSGQASVQDIAIRIIDGATGADQAIVDAKVAAANLFTASLDQGNEIVRYSGDAGIDFGQAYLDQVTSAATVPTQAQVDAQISAFVTSGTIPGGGPIGDFFTLTAASLTSTGVDNITGTADADTFRAIDGGSLSSSDTINGGAGFDTLNISANGISGNSAAPVISNVERINNSDAGATLNLAAVSGVQQLWSSGGAGTYTYTNAALGTIFGASGAGAKTVNVNIAASTTGAADTLNFAVDDNNGAVATFTSTEDAASIEGISIAALGGAGAGATGDAIDDAVNINAFTAAKTLTVTGAGDIVVTAGAISTLTTVDTSAATGAVTIDATGAAQAVTFTGGAGVDTFYGGAGNDIINGGAGNDILLGQNGNDTITGGAGADTMTGGAGNDTFVIEGGITVGSFDTVTDFVTGADKLEFGGVAGSAANYSELAATLSFSDAREAADAALNGTVLYAETTIASTNTTYVFADTNGDGTADQVVALTGGAAVAFGDII